MTRGEHACMATTAQLWNELCNVVGDGPTRSADLGELITHVHAIQNAIMSQAAARCYPGRYRLHGSTLAPTWDAPTGSRDIGP